MAKIRLRKRDFSTSGNGTEEHRRIRLPDGTTGWASDLATNVTGDWPKRSDRKEWRAAKQVGEVPAGTVIVDFERRFRAFEGQGRATITAGLVLEEPDADGNTVAWGLEARRVDEKVQVVLPDGSVVEV